MITVVDYHKGNLMSVERGLAAQGADVVVTDDAGAIARAEALVLPGVGAFADAAAAMERLGQREAILEALDRGAVFLGICLGMHLMFEAGEEGATEGEPLPQGLGLIPGTVGRLPKHDAEGRSYKIPHVGWNTLELPAAPRSEAEQVPLGVASHGTPSCGFAAERSEASPFRGKPSSPTEVGFLGLSPQSDASCEPSLSQFDLRGFESPLLAGIEPGEYFYFTHSYAAPESDATIARTQHSVIFPSAVQASPRAFGVQFHPEKSSEAGARLLGNFVRIANER